MPAELGTMPKLSVHSRVHMNGGSWLLGFFCSWRVVEVVHIDLLCLVGSRAILWDAGRDVTPTLHIVQCSGVMSGTMEELRRERE